MSDEARRENRPFDAVACSGVVRNHCAILKQSKADNGETQIEFLYIGPIALSPIDPAGLMVVLHPDDMAQMAMVEREQLARLNS